MTEPGNARPGGLITATLGAFEYSSSCRSSIGCSFSSGVGESAYRNKSGGGMALKREVRERGRWDGGMACVGVEGFGGGRGKEGGGREEGGWGAGGGGGGGDEV